MVTATSDTYPRIGALTNISPFTYRDGTTYLEQLEKMRVFLNDDVVDGFNDRMTNIIDEFNNGLLSVEEFHTAYAAEVDAKILAINNRVGPVGVQETTITAPYTVTVDPTWPTVHPVLFVITQDNNGGHSISVGEGIVGDVITNTAPNGVTRFTLVPVNGAWKLVNETQNQFNVMSFGATGDGVTDDTTAIRNTVTLANLYGGTVFLPRGDYLLPRGGHKTFVFPGDGQFTDYLFDVADNVTIQGSGARLVEDVDYDTRRIMFYVRGSNITFDSLIFENVYDLSNGSRPTSIPIAGGDAYDASFTSDVENIRILNCTFNRSWHPVKFGHTKANGTSVIRNITVQGCSSNGDALTTSSGGYNFSSKPAGRIRDVSVIGSKCNDVTVSAAIGFYGVFDMVANGNTCHGSQLNGAGIQLENGADNAVISGNTLVNHYNHIWVDDSTNVSITGNSCKNIGVDSNFKGVRVTYEGYTENISKISTNIVASANVLQNCYIVTEPFGNRAEGSTPGIGNINFSGNHIELDGVTNIHGIRMGAALTSIIANNTIVGASQYSIRFEPKAGQDIVCEGNVTLQKNVETSQGIGFTNLNAYAPIVSNNRFDNGIATDLTYVSSRIGSTSIIVGTGDPANKISATPGSIYLRNDATTATTAFYVKTGPGLLGWVAK